MTSETSLVWQLIQNGERPTASQLVSEHRLSGWQSAQRIVEAVAPGEAVRAKGAIQTVRGLRRR